MRYLAIVLGVVFRMGPTARTQPGITAVGPRATSRITGAPTRASIPIQEPRVPDVTQATRRIRSEATTGIRTQPTGRIRTQGTEDPACEWCPNGYVIGNLVGYPG
jgi:hypothetical protein